MPGCLIGLAACGDQRRLTRSGSALEALGDDALYKSTYFTFLLLFSVKFSILCTSYASLSETATRQTTLFRLCAAEAIMFSLCPVVPMSVPTSEFLSLRSNMERISMKFRRCSHYHQQMHWLQFGRNGNRDKKTGYDRKFESTSNQCCHVASAENAIIWPLAVLSYLVFFCFCTQPLLTAD